MSLKLTHLCPDLANLRKSCLSAKISARGKGRSEISKIISTIIAGYRFLDIGNLSGVNLA